jgi:DNA-directed RNA polymerase subunit RPC12/RpoP
MDQSPEQRCLECGSKLIALFFMAVIHDGYMCEHCGLYDSVYLRKLAKAY